MHDRAAQQERALTDSAHHASGIDDLIEGLTRQNTHGLECLQLRQEYAKKIQDIGLPDQTFDEGRATLDAIIKYHLALLVNETVGSRSVMRPETRILFSFCAVVVLSLEF